MNMAEKKPRAECPEGKDFRASASLHDVVSVFVQLYSSTHLKTQKNFILNEKLICITK